MTSFSGSNALVQLARDFLFGSHALVQLVRDFLLGSNALVQLVRYLLLGNNALLGLVRDYFLRKYRSGRVDGPDGPRWWSFPEPTTADQAHDQRRHRSQNEKDEENGGP